MMGFFSTAKGSDGSKNPGVFNNTVSGRKNNEVYNGKPDWQKGDFPNDAEWDRRSGHEAAARKNAGNN